MLNIIILCVIRLCVIILNVIVPSTVMLKVIVSYSDSQHTITDYCYAECHVLCG
jgi:hypothetical protein